MLALIKDLLGIKSNNTGKSKGNFCLPIESIKDLVIAKDGVYRIVLKVSPVNGELLSDDSLEIVSDSIQRALSLLDGRIGIYIQSEGINIENNISFIEQYKLSINSEIKLILLDEQKKHIQSMASRSRNVLNFYTVFETRAQNFVSAQELLYDACQAFKAELEAQDMYAEQLYENDIKALLYERMNPQSSQAEQFNSQWEIENILPENAKIFKDGRNIEIENRIYRFYCLVKYPATVESYRWLRRVFNTKGDINIAIILTPKNKATIAKELSKAVNEIGAKALDARKDESLRQKYQAEKESAVKMIAELGNENIALYDTNITISISAADIKELNTLSNLLRSKISSVYCQATELKYKRFEPFITTLPILADNKITQNYVWNLTTKDISSLIPYDSSELMEPKGIFIGENVISGGLVIIDTYNKIYNNPHECIIADSGSGKSFRIKTDAIRPVSYTHLTLPTILRV